MANRFEKEFSHDMSTEEIDKLWCRIITKVEPGTEEANQLSEARDKAWNVAYHREFEERRNYEQAHSKDGMECIYTRFLPKIRTNTRVRKLTIIQLNPISPALRFNPVFAHHNQLMYIHYHNHRTGFLNPFF